jgi:hypothetical protein
MAATLSSSDAKRKQKQAWILKAAQLYEQAASMVNTWDSPSGDEAGDSPGKVSPPSLVQEALQKAPPKCEQEESEEESDSEPGRASESGLAPAVGILPAAAPVPPAAINSHSRAASDDDGRREKVREPRALAASSPGGESPPGGKPADNFVTPRPRVHRDPGAVPPPTGHPT